MKRISTDAEFLNSGKVVIDADGIPVNISNKADKQYVDDALEDKAGKSALNGLATETYVDDAVEPKADKAYVDQVVPVRMLAGQGFPEGKVSAPVGSIYTDSAATAGAIRWVKTTGTGATGWEVEYGDTGWRRLEPVGEYFTGEGSILLRRIGSTVTIQFESVGVDTQGNTLIYLTEPSYIPVSFRCSYGDRPSFWVSNNNANPNYLLTIAQGSRIRYQTTTTPNSHPGTGSHALRGQGTWVTDEPWPTTLPGTPA